VQNATFWRALLGVEKTVVEEIEFDEDEQVLVADVRPGKRARGRCGRCQRRSPAFDRREGRRRWRALDLGTVQVLLEAESPRANSREHGKNPLCRSLPCRPLGNRRARRGPPPGGERVPWRRHPGPGRRASGQAKALKHARFALWRNPENLTTPQQAKLAWVAKTDPRLHRAYLQGRSPTTGLPAPGR
jgi:transposase